MEIEFRAGWVRLADGRWANLEKCDLVEVHETGKVWQVRAWNAMQPQVEAYILAEFEEEKAARAFLPKFFEAFEQHQQRG